MSAFWTPEQLAQLEALVDDGMSAGQIARSTGRTRNSVIGQCHRLDITLKGRMKLYPRSGCRWRAADDAKVVRLLSEGHALDYIAEDMGRPPGSCDERLRKALGHTPPWPVFHTQRHKPRDYPGVELDERGQRIDAPEYIPCNDGAHVAAVIAAGRFRSREMARRWP